jgi:membrane-anchored protein YejM (alkaline phosphatase superfamily)
MQFAKKGLDQIYKNISNRLHDRFFFNIIFDMPFDLYHAHLKSYAHSRVGACYLLV